MSSPQWFLSSTSESFASSTKSHGGSASNSSRRHRPGLVTSHRHGRFQMTLHMHLLHNYTDCAVFFSGEDTDFFAPRYRNASTPPNLNTPQPVVIPIYTDWGSSKNIVDIKAEPECAEIFILPHTYCMSQMIVISGSMFGRGGRMRETIN